MHNLENVIESIRLAETADEYEQAIQQLHDLLRTAGYSEEIEREVLNREKYTKNRFSDEINVEHMKKAREQVVCYLNSLEQQEEYKTDLQRLETYLRNFYLFIATMREKTPDKRASLQKEALASIAIENEYDVQHLLYAVLRPLYPEIRKEVAEDSGVGMIRSDLKIQPLSLIIETKCTRKSLSLKQLTEQIEADICHYQAEHIWFYIYDKEKVIENVQNYEKHFNATFDGKHIKLIVQQPVCM